MFGLFGTFGVIDWPKALEGQKYAKINTATQQKLKDLGFDPGTIDGLLGPATKSAVAKFETAWALPADESWADFLDSLDVAYRGRSTGGAVAAPAKPPTQSQVMTVAAGGKPSFLASIKSKLNFKDPKVIAVAGIAGIGLVLLLAPKGGRKSGGSRKRR